jgi:hypothetical protein
VALGGVVAGAAGCGDAEDARSKLPDTTGDVGIVRRLIALEDETAAVYQASGMVLRGRERALAQRFLTQERAHARRLRQALRQLGSATSGPKRGEALPPPRSHAAAREAIDMAEQRAIAAYLDALPKLSEAGLRLLAGAILTVQAEHLAAFALVRGEPPAPAAFVRREP